MPTTQINLHQKKEKKAIAPKQTHTHKKPLRDKKKEKEAMLRQKDKQKSLNFIIYNL